MRFPATAALVLASSVSGLAAAQSVTGDWEGLLDAGAAQFHLVLHLAQSSGGGLQGSVDSIDQPGGNGIAVTTVTFRDSTLKFNCSSITAGFEGKLKPDGASIEGTWTQLKPYRIIWTRAAVNPAPVTVSDLVGAWHGDLRMGLASIALVVRLMPVSGGLRAAMDSPDRDAAGVPARSAKLDNGFLTIDWKSLGAVLRGRLNADRSALEGTFSQRGVERQLTLKRVRDESELVRRRPQTPAKPYPYREERVSYPTDGGRVDIGGTLTIPEGAGPFPAAVLIAGSGPNDRDESIAGHKLFLVLADYLTRRGIAVLRFDKRGVGESTGDFADAITLDFAADAATAVSYLTFRKEVDGRRIGLIGHSEGGMIAPMVAANNHKIAFIVLLAGPGVSGPELAAEQAWSAVLVGGGNEAAATEAANQARTIVAAINRAQGHPSKLKSELQQELGADFSDSALNTLLAKFDDPWIRSLLAIDPADALRKVTCPVLALNGSKDTQVPAGPNLKAIGDALLAGGNRVWKTAQLPGLNHLFQTAPTGAPEEYGRIEETFSPIALDAISSWILENDSQYSGTHH